MANDRVPPQKSLFATEKKQGLERLAVLGRWWIWRGCSVVILGLKGVGPRGTTGDYEYNAEEW